MKSRSSYTRPKVFKNQLLWFDYDQYLVKVIKVIDSNSPEYLKSLAVPGPGIFLSHNPFVLKANYFVAFSYFEELKIRVPSDAQNTLFDETFKNLNKALKKSIMKKIDVVKVDVCDKNPLSVDYIDKIHFSFPDCMSVTIVGKR